MNFSFDEHHFCDETVEFQVEHERAKRQRSKSKESSVERENIPEEKPKKHKCDNCEKSFNKSTDLRKHEVILIKL